MKDTPPALEARYAELLRRAGPQRRLAMGASMLRTARSLAVLGIIDRLGDDDPVAVRRELFLRFYGDDLPEPHRTRALERVIAAARRSARSDRGAR